MGIDVDIYVGPFVVCKTVLKKVFVEIMSCSNKSCGNYGREIIRDTVKFCESCGSEIQKASKQVESEGVDWEEIDGLVDATLTVCLPDGDKYSHIWYPNIEIKGIGREVSLELYQSEYVSLSSMGVGRELALFEKQFSHEIAILVDEYGSENVDTGWGLVKSVW